MYRLIMPLAVWENSTPGISLEFSPWRQALPRCASGALWMGAWAGSREPIVSGLKKSGFPGEWTLRAGLEDGARKKKEYEKQAQ